MKKMRNLIFVILVCFIAVVTIAEKSQAVTEIVSVDVGGAKVAFPNVEGLTNEVLNNANMKDFFETFVGKEATLLSVYIKDSDLKIWLTGISPLFQEYIFIQVINEYADSEFTTKDIDSLKDSINKDNFTFSEVFKSDDFKNTVGDLESGMSKKFDSNFDMKINEVKSLGIVGEGDNYISIGTLSNTQIDAGGVAVDVKQVMTVSYIRASDRFILLTIYRTYQDKEDITSGISRCNTVSELIVQSNPSSIVESIAGSEVEPEQGRFAGDTPAQKNGKTAIRWLFKGVFGVLGLILLFGLWTMLKLIVKKFKK
ncbi:MAG: hypothetical protein BA863_11070 [Desulfovibrio sp. S3730MH75]|nr:MAG: hypothetical protein BA863_11070 [Desulfovibrio sp. S3730MH75]